MDRAGIILELQNKFPGPALIAVEQNYPDEVCIRVKPEDFKKTCLGLHKMFTCPVMTLFAVDERGKTGNFELKCVFLSVRRACWVIVSTDIPAQMCAFDTLARDMHSASLFEREIWEMFGIKPVDSPDARRLVLHDEVWPSDNYPLRKDFKQMESGALGNYQFGRVEGEGVFEVPVGPVHAGIIGPGHFRFSVAGEPIINLESRLGWTHRGVEKLLEGKNFSDALSIVECISGDSCFAHSLSFAFAAEKICGVQVPVQALNLRAIFLELERMYNHVNDIGGMAVDVGFSFPAAYASIIKEAILRLNELLTASRYLKKTNRVGGLSARLEASARDEVKRSLAQITGDFNELTGILNSSVSFMDRVDTTGILKRKTALDLGVVGLAARASGIGTDMRKYFPGVYKEAKFKTALEQSGDVLARLKVRIFEFEESARLIAYFLKKVDPAKEIYTRPLARAGSALGYVEGWRGPVIYWLRIDDSGIIERCKITDPSFHNWQGLNFAALGNIIPDFPLCNKSFDLSYSGNDL